jgi:hypothetical protein
MHQHSMITQPDHVAVLVMLRYSMRHRSPVSSTRRSSASTRSRSSGVSGHENLPVGGHEGPGWWPLEIPVGGRQVSR